MKSIKNILMVYIFCLVLAITSILGISAYMNSSKALLLNEKKNLLAIAKESSKVFESRIKAELNKLEKIAIRDEVVNSQISMEEKMVFLRKEMSIYGYNIMDIIDTNGHALATNGKTYKLKERGYFKKAINGESNVSNPILSVEDGSSVIVLAVPIRENGIITGVLAAVKNGDFLSNMINDVKIGETGYAYMTDEKGFAVAHRDNKLVINRYNVLEDVENNPDLEEIANLTRRMINDEIDTGEYDFRGQEKFLAFTPIEGTNWKLAISVTQDEVLGELDTLGERILLWTAVVLVLGLGVAYLLGTRIGKPIGLVTDQAKKLANGDLSNNMEEKLLKRKDEVGQLANAFNLMNDSFKNMVNSIKDSSEQLHISAENFIKVSEEMSYASEDVSKTAEEIATGATNQARDTENGSEKLNELGEDIEKNQEYMKELNESIKRVVISVEEGLNIVNDLNKKAEESDKAVKDVYNGILETNRSSEKIDEASEVISSIAEQTNLLALNAAIEAARAGDAGKGFAVVAEEIRKLAEQSSLSTSHIDEAVSELQRNSSASVHTIEKVLGIIEEQQVSTKNTGEKYREIETHIDSTSHSIEKLNEASKNMESRKESLLDVMGNLSAVAQQNAASTEEVSASMEEQSATMEEVANSSRSLRDLSSSLKENISKFKI
ncbi:MAG: methyl-accepting chemotaxis protein [Anaeromicrobium sp.]|uniref:methyl-accepting chemotaxis protein n=1 Tax=Anaeromicrobium sp. TaxID=1929132 RepID=UPI0025DF2EA3|nr:methyl-accepting chemotaxis protein [Anaeromicrobium sp.]MCT4595400.1 methyl-accepting chemotaxis protein [Anaeromicrobium sp.]